MAGAGSGKTSVLTNRVAYLVKDQGVNPFNILAITFTNKAAQEMKERIQLLIDYDISKMAVATFHSLCARCLRIDADKLGYDSNFSIYDSADARTVVKAIMREMDIDQKEITPQAVQSGISRAKNSGKSPAEYMDDLFYGMGDKMSTLLARYENRLKSENAMDFDDLLINMVRLLETNEEVRRYYTNRFQYIMVDEYQDTNSVQYQLVKILGEKYKNVFVVGDDDQSIYAWRGADIRNILDFEKDYRDTKVIKLEQNYRSHEKILRVANAVISKAAERKDKTVWSAEKEGEKPFLFNAGSDFQEAEFVVREIRRLVDEGRQYSDMAVLYRSHNQSRVIEEKLRTYGIPYQIYGGLSFYDRKEIKDILAYLALIDNPNADTEFMRVINEPKRGIGTVTLDKLISYAEENGLSYLQAAEMVSEDASNNLSTKFKGFAELFSELSADAEEMSVGELVKRVYEASGYRAMLTDTIDTENRTRMDNIDELVSAAYTYEETAENPSLTDYLSSLSLISDVDTMTDEGSVTLMTIHSAKGLEFDTVFMVGMEETVFPTWRSIEEGKTDEERRLCYVGITRAKKLLYFSNCQKRNVYATTKYNKPSQFLEDISEDMLSLLTPPKKTQEQQPTESRKKKTPTMFQEHVKFKAHKQGAPAADYKVGMNVSHNRFGTGKIKEITGQGDATIALIAFPEGDKKMFLALAPLKIV